MDRLPVSPPTKGPMMVRPTDRAARTSLAAVVAALALAVPGIAAAQEQKTAVAPSQAVVSILRPHVAYAQARTSSAPRGLLRARTAITEERTVVPVLARRGAFIEVMLPGHPNGRVGWIDQAHTVSLETPWHIVVDLSQRLVTVYRSGRPVKTFQAVVGKRSTPTPTGRFYVEETVALPASDDAAPLALALSARSNVLRTFDGAPAQTALHGLSNIGGVPGTAVSHGCVRLDSATMHWLAKRIATGTPVTITA
jgi:lipoprotein-anchoring transpeptidase ErfK/SrfK